MYFQIRLLKIYCTKIVCLNGNFQIEKKKTKQKVVELVNYFILAQSNNKLVK